jgi:ATP-dependent DNA helicase RecQ
MESLLAGQDVLVVMPTGSGKSAIYQVPALLMDGPTVVVSPLIALQRDQAAHLDRADAAEAVTINSAETARNTDEAWEAVDRGRAEYLFLAPEQLAKDDVLDRVAQARPSLFVVDEAHCISAWGHGFRPEYLRLGEVVDRLGHPVVLALTATAAPMVRTDIVEHLGMRDPRLVIAGFDRPNLHLEVQQFFDDSDKRQAVLARAREEGKPGLVYVATRKDAEWYAGELLDAGVAAAAYHAGMKAKDRTRIHDEFIGGDLEVVAATSAFGMGIDKPDVRFVLHASIPDSLDSYYQEIGRAGRDEAPANAVLFYRSQDLGLQKFLTARSLDQDALAEVAETIHSHDGAIATSELTEQVDQSHKKVANLVNLLQQGETVTADERGRLEYANDDLGPGEAVTQAVGVAEAHQQTDRSRNEMMRGYAETIGCRRQFLLGYFGEKLDQPCGNCDTCDSGATEQRQVGRDGPYPAHSKVRHLEWGSGVVMHNEDDRVTVLFEQVGYKTLSLAAVEAGGLLEKVDEEPPG